MPDTRSRNGLDDDARVLNAVASGLDRTDLRVTVPPRDNTNGTGRTD